MDNSEIKEKKIPTFEEIRRSRKPIVNANIEYQKKLSSLDRFAVWITNHIGTMGFFFVILAWTIIWLSWNVLAPTSWRFDPFPAFVLWLFISNMIQLFFLPLIMVGQNLQGLHAEARAEADFEINMKAEQEVETILLHLENQHQLLLEALNRLDKKKK